ncbi:MAG: hypothetical protein IT385_16935 [Deltaproteobacteria bacterium]|nr:hypothetical protein [Deltaproteobacteria bacterium]
MQDHCTQCGSRFGDGDRFCARCGAARGQAARPRALAEAAPSEEPHRRPRKLGAVITLAVVMAVVPFVIFMCMSFGSGSAKGKLTARGPSGTFEFVPDGCQSMQPFGRAGANVHGKGPNDGGVYISVDPIDGTRVDVEVPGSCKTADGRDCTVFRVPRAACKVFEVEVEFSGVVVNDVRQYEGRTRLECDLPDGTHIEADLTYDGC